MFMKLKLKRSIAACSFFLTACAPRAQDSVFTNIIGMELIPIQPGSFIMARFQPPYPKPPADTTNSATKAGDEKGYNAEEYRMAEELAKRDAQPGFTATIKKPFYIGKFEVTQAQWKKVMGSNPSFFQGNKVSDIADDHPVEQVTWEDVQQFLDN